MGGIGSGRKGGCVENLVNFRDMSPEKKAEIDKRALEAKRKNKLFREMCQEMLANIDKKTGKTNREVIMEQLVGRAKNGDTKALSLMYKMSGEDVKQIEFVGDTPLKIDLTTE